MIRKIKLSGFIFSILHVISCSFAPEYKRPDLKLHDVYHEVSPEGESISNLKWWEIFQDPHLQDLIKTAIQENKNLKIAAARIEASRALLGITSADLYPRIDVAGVSQRVDFSDEALALAFKPNNNFGIFGNLSYEMDFWSRVRNATDAQRAELLASEYGARAVLSSLISQTAVLYIRILGNDNRIKIAKRTLENRKGATKVIKARLEKGVVPELDLNQAQVEEADSAVAAVISERESRLAENALSVLLGRPPGAIKRGLPLEKHQFIASIPASYPAELLERRPDLIASEEQVKAALYSVGVARAEQYPTFNLLGTVGLQSREIDNLPTGNAFTWSIGSNFLGPLLDWGKAASNVDYRQALAAERYRQYEQNVLVATQEVEDALVAIRTFRDERIYRQAQVKAGRNASKLSRARYDDGVTSYLEVLDNERSLFNSELADSLALENYYIAIVQLYRSLGGGWHLQ